MAINLDDDCRQNLEEKEVVDERCYCGHLKSEHYGGYRQLPCNLCKCQRFTWFGWVFSDGSEV